MKGNVGNRCTSHVEDHRRSDSVRVWDESRYVDAKIVLWVRVCSDAHSPEDITYVGIPKEGIGRGLGIAVGSQWFRDGYLE